MRTTLKLTALLIFLNGCSGSLPTHPTDITTLPIVKMQALTRNVGSLGPALGVGMATNNTDTAGWFVHILFEYGDGINQIDRGRSISDAAPSQTVDTFARLEIEDDGCTTWQDDTFWMLPKAGRYTISDTRNYPPVISRLIKPTKNCRLPPSAPPLDPPPPVSCRVDAFSSWEGHVEGDTIIEHVTVKPGYGGIVAYLVSWGVPTFRVGGNVPLPQPRVHLTSQTLYVGVNILTAPLAASTYAGWQWEFGCEPGPTVLTEENLLSFPWIDSGWGNFLPG